MDEVTGTRARALLPRLIPVKLRLPEVEARLEASA